MGILCWNAEVIIMKKVRWRESKKIRSILWNTIVYIILCSFGILVLLPFFWMISSSFKTDAEIFVFPPKWIPSKIMWQNYPQALTSFPFLRSLRNTLIITIGVLIGQLLTASMTAFAFARLRFRLRESLFILVLSTMMIPYQVTLIPTYILFKTLNWVDTFLPLIVPAYFGGGAFFIFLLRQFFMTIPIELDDAAKIDGCTTWRIYWNIILPLAKPALATVAIFSFYGSWNDFLGPLIYLNSPEKHTLSIALQYYRLGMTFGPTRTWAHLMVASLVVMLPCIILFFFTQRYFIQGVVITGLKE